MRSDRECTCGCQEVAPPPCHVGAECARGQGVPSLLSTSIGHWTLWALLSEYLAIEYSGWHVLADNFRKIGVF